MPTSARPHHPSFPCRATSNRKDEVDPLNIQRAGAHARPSRQTLLPLQRIPKEPRFHHLLIFPPLLVTPFQQSLELTTEDPLLQRTAQYFNQSVLRAGNTRDAFRCRPCFDHRKTVIFRTTPSPSVAAANSLHARSIRRFLLAFKTATSAYCCVYCSAKLDTHLSPSSASNGQRGAGGGKLEVLYGLAGFGGTQEPQSKHILHECGTRQ